MADEEMDPEDLPHFNEIVEDPEGFILKHFAPAVDETTESELYLAATMIVGTALVETGLDPETVADQLSKREATIKLGPEGLEIDFTDPDSEGGLSITIEER